MAQADQFPFRSHFLQSTEKKSAEASKAHLEKTKKYPEPIVTEIVPATAFYRAEDYHQGYARKNAFRYGLYRQGSGRAGYLKKTWGSDEH